MCNLQSGYIQERAKGNSEVCDLEVMLKKGPKMRANPSATLILGSFYLNIRILL